jgi:general stress protein 26
MTSQELMNKLEGIIENAKAGILATTDESGCAHMRWLTPIVIKQRPGCLYAFTTAGSAKTIHLEKTPAVEWMVQTRSITEVVNIRGHIRMVDNPALKAEIMEKIGSRLTVFWKANPNKDDLIVLETVIEEAVYFKPMKAIRETVKF